MLGTESVWRQRWFTVSAVIGGTPYMMMMISNDFLLFYIDFCVTELKIMELYTSA